MTTIFLNDVDVYIRIAEEHIQAIQMQQENKKIDSLMDFAHSIVENRGHAMGAIVFSAFALEAYINDYAARNRSNRFFKEHFDSLDFVSKWVVISEFFTGKPFPKDSECYERLQELRTFRNKLAHPKSKFSDTTNQSNSHKIGEEAYLLIRNAKRSVETVSMVIDCLAELDPSEKEYILSHKNL